MFESRLFVTSRMDDKTDEAKWRVHCVNMGLMVFHSPLEYLTEFKE